MSGELVFTVSTSTDFEADYAAERATAAGPLLLNLQGVDLGYDHGARHGTTMATLLESHQPLDVSSDEGFKIRGYIYLIEFDGGAIKYGYTSDLHTRINTHVKKLCRTHSFKITRLWVSVPTINPTEVEFLLRKHARRWSDGRRLERLTPNGQGETEVGYDMDFDAMVSVARRLLYTPVTPVNTAAALTKRRQSKYSSLIRHALYRHLSATGSLNEFSLPTTPFDGPTVSKAPLTYFDLTTTDGLASLLDAGLLPWRHLTLSNADDAKATTAVPPRRRRVSSWIAELFIRRHSQ
ncbi:GIY-YIG nuclease family protein [Rhodococcus erythropolis]|uniref:GIY-YIG nuclease family protein n=1 Tax=Rhodococcus erythropolis TaxID=1833 RepID=A0AAX4A025_RHOER|nr:GIY-YIG nuclease family protein [Rhodococcus erythropolis]WMN01886.1 GIY-YIG nuclease family protein [Rhodococcus erythropolis]WMN03172.1 GIY-YIG nuclease family protein [Rhodococcus erythropolis]